jgi:hypothetical protein
VVFLCPSKTQVALCRLYAVLVECIEQPVTRLAGSFVGSLNLIHSTAQRFPSLSGRYPLYKRIHRMTTPTKPNAFATNFNHRLNTELDAHPTRLRDCMDPALERAAAIADLMEVAFEAGGANEISNLWRAAQAIRFEILDARAMLRAYGDGVQTSPKSLQPED